MDDVELSFTPDALDEMAHIAVEMNDSRENIAPRCLHTLIEELLDEVAFSGGENGPEKIEIDGKYVREHLSTPCSSSTFLSRLSDKIEFGSGRAA